MLVNRILLQTVADIIVTSHFYRLSLSSEIVTVLPGLVKSITLVGSSYSGTRFCVDDNEGALRLGDGCSLTEMSVGSVSAKDAIVSF